MSSPDARPAEQQPGLDQLGTPEHLRAPQPEEVAPTAPAEPLAPEPRRHGFRGFLDTIAYGVKYALLSVFGAGEQPRESDPIERLRRKYGRPPRKY